MQSYFASGTGLQEMYISPDLLSEQNWDDLAASAKWARTHAAVLRDSHWIGGDPVRLQVYGWGAWAPGEAVIALRNPGDEAQEFRLDIAAALELPGSEPRAWNARSVYDQSTPFVLQAGQPAVLKLQPFEVVVLELLPRS